MCQSKDRIRVRRSICIKMDAIQSPTDNYYSTSFSSRTSISNMNVSDLSYINRIFASKCCSVEATLMCVHVHWCTYRTSLLLCRLSSNHISV